ncbi:MAG: hypothetical protein QM757_06535 [Paludibaculum sp.]
MMYIGRHAGDAAAEVAAVAIGAAAGHDADAAVDRDGADRVGILVEPGLAGCVDGHIDDPTYTEADEDAFLDPAS